MRQLHIDAVAAGCHRTKDVAVMLVRILTSVVGAPLLLAVLFWCPEIAWAVVIAAVCTIAMYELLSALQLKKCIPLVSAAMLFAAAAPFFVYLPQYLWVYLLIVVGYAALLMCISVFCHQMLTMERVGTVFFLTLTSVLSLASLSYMRYMENGVLYILLTLVIPWMSDTGAYFTGTFIGKHKLCPQISPKKTVEGLIGGLLFSVLCAMLTGCLYSLAVTCNVAYGRIVVLAVVLAPLSVVGDLFASVLKRQNGIKDYGKLFPGHGGVMDRFDSVSAIALLLFTVVQFWPVVL